MTIMNIEKKVCAEVQRHFQSEVLAKVNCKPKKTQVKKAEQSDQCYLDLICFEYLQASISGAAREGHEEMAAANKGRGGQQPAKAEVTCQTDNTVRCKIIIIFLVVL